MAVSATIHPALNPAPDSQTWDHTAATIHSALENFASLARNCAELNLHEECRAISDLMLRLERWQASVAVVGSSHTGKTALLNALFGTPLPKQIHFNELRLVDSAPIPECDVLILVVSARAPLFDGSLQFLKRVNDPEKLLVVVTNTSSFPSSRVAAILEHVATTTGARRVLPVDSKEGTGISCVQLELHRLVVRRSIMPLVDSLAVEALRVCHTVENAAIFTEQALRSDSSEYERSYRTAVSDLDGLARATAAIEQSLAGGDAKLQALIPRLTTGILAQMEQAAEERIESANAPAIAGLQAPTILAAANEAALRVFEHFQDYALKEFKHAVGLAMSELDRIRSAAEIRIQELMHNFLGSPIAFSLMGPEPLSRPLDQGLTGMDDWLTQQTVAIRKSLATAPAYRQQALDTLRQLFLSALKHSIRQHWEAVGNPDEVLRTLLANALQRFFRAPVEELKNDMIRIRKALDRFFSSRRLELLATPTSRETRHLLADLNVERREQCDALREYLQRLAAELAQ